MSKDHKLVLDVHEKPKLSTIILMGIQHVVAMSGANIAVAFITGIPISVVFFTSGIGTLIFVIATRAKVPAYLGASFAYVTAMSYAREALGGNFSAVQTGLLLVGLSYVLIALLIKVAGRKWIDKLLPPIVIAPMIMVIGLGLAGYAINNAGLTTTGTWKEILVAFVTFIVAAFISMRGKGFTKIIPFLIAIIAGYIVSLCLGLIDFQPVLDAKWLALPELAFPLKLGDFREYHFYFGPETWMILPVVIATIAEHIGNVGVLGNMTNHDFLQNPEIERTFIGNGLATSFSAILGGAAETAYGENIAVIGFTKIASIYTIVGAAFIATLLSFVGKISALINTIPLCVLGGLGMLLYGVIASNGLRILIDNKIDFTKQRNLIIVSAMLIIGIGGAIFPITATAQLSGSALAAIVGIILNLILPKEKSEVPPQTDYIDIGEDL